jgi:GNAT superfamily N-acetyltransferase
MTPNVAGAAPIVAGTYTVRAATPLDTPRILALVSRSLGEGNIPRDESFWRWKHDESPFGPSACLVAEDGEDIIGLRVFMRWRWQAAGRMLRAVRAVDTATDARWRGRGIFSRLTMELVGQMQREGVTLVYNTPNRYSLPGYLKMGWTGLGRTSVWIRPLRPMKLVRLAARVRAPSAAATAARADAVLPDNSSVLGLLKERQLPAFLSAATALESRLSTPLSGDYVAWRYARIPGFRYEAKWDFGTDHKALLLYRRKTHDQFTELRIAELVIGEGAASRRRAGHLIHDVLRSSDCDVASARARGPGARTVLAAAGFVAVPRLGPTFTVRPLNDPAHGIDPLRLRNWAPSIGDLEIF